MIKRSGIIRQYFESTRSTNSSNQYYQKITEANKLINDESNRIITWSLSVIGGSILTIISTEYVNPKGYILYSYILFASGWIYLAISIYFGEKISRHYIAGITTNATDISTIAEIGKKIDRAFASQISHFKYGIFTFAIWLIVFLIWYIVSKN